MDFKLKTRLFGYFGHNAKVKDTFKDVNGKGIDERYQESLGESYDELISDLADNFTERTLIPKEMLAAMVPYMENMLGDPVVVKTDLSMRRKILGFAQHIYNIRSTHLSYEVLFKMLGFETVTVQEFTSVSGFDSDTTFDDDFRTFDNSERFCSDYSILLTGAIPIDSLMVKAILRIIEFLEPINADLREVSYNGQPITLGLITIYIENGLQFYDNSNDPGIQLLLQTGKLYKDGANAGKYVMIDGYLYYDNS